jgi:hypothetical protein
MSNAFLGKFRLDAAVVEESESGPLQLHGYWAIYDVTISSTEPVEQYRCPNGRDCRDDAINDAMRSGEARMSELHEADSAVQ